MAGYRRMNHPFLIGERIYLRGLERGDLDTNYFQWFNDAEVTKYMVHGIFPNSMQAMQEFFDHVTTSEHDVVFAVVDRETETHIGNVGLHRIDWVRRLAEFGIIIGEKEFWGRGYGTEATRLMVEYGFERLNLNRIFLGVHADHEAGIRAYEKAGFTIEGRLRQEMYTNGRYCDRLIMGILRDEYSPSGPEGVQ